MTEPEATYSKRRRNARRVEQTGSVVAGAAGSAFGAAKLRDLHAKQYGNAHSHLIGHVPDKVLLHEPGFKTAAIGATAGLAAAGAAHYGDAIKAKRARQLRRQQPSVSKSLGVSGRRGETKDMTGRSIGKRVTALTEPHYDEVSLVDIPAAQYAAVMIAKRHTQGADMPDNYEGSIFDADGTELDEADLDTGDVVYGEDGQAYAYTAPEVDERELVGAGASVEKRGNPLLGLGRREIAKREPHSNLAEEISKALTAATSDADRDEVIKSFAGLVQEQQEQLNSVAKAAQYERDLRLEGQYVEVAKNLGLPIAPTELGPVLKRMAEVMSDEDLGVIAKALDATSGLLYEELGYAGVLSQEEGDIEDAEAYADTLVGKAAGERISKAQGVEMYYASNDDAYIDYINARR